MVADDLLLDRDGRVALVTFNRPEARNAMTFEMYERLHDLCGELDRNPEDVILSCYLSRDFREGVRAFLDKRKPEWEGR
jgi:enoyl-CoA hydratase/carnithine racemase